MPHQQHSHPRKYGKDSRACRCCTNSEGLIRKYELMICRRCFREQAAQIGFKKLRWTQCDLYTKVTICDATNCAWSKSLRPAIYLYRPESPRRCSLPTIARLSLSVFLCLARDKATRLIRPPLDLTKTFTVSTVLVSTIVKSAASPSL